MTTDPRTDHYAAFRSADRFEVRVTPKASRNEVQIESIDPPRLRVKVTVVPEDGKANAAVVKLMSKQMKLAKSRFELLSGATSRDKVFRIRAD